MTRKFTYVLLTLSLIGALMVTGLQSTPAHAEGANTTDSDFPVSLEINGTIQTLTATHLVLADSTTFAITKKTQIGSGLKSGALVAVVAEFDSDAFVAKSITAISASDGSTDNNNAANDPGNGNGNGNGQGNNIQGNTNPGDDNGQGNNKGGKGKGKGNNNQDEDDPGNNKGGKGKGKGQGNSNQGDDDQGNNKGGKGKGQSNAQGNKGGKDNTQDKKFTQCMNNPNVNPVATKLAEALGKSYSEIMTWHCKGNGFGSIARAYVVAGKVPSLSVEMLLNKHKGGKNWVGLVKEAGLDVKDITSLGQLTNGKGKKDKGNDKSGD
jgi:hypothetical protein